MKTAVYNESSKMKDVEFSKHYDYSFGTRRYFWRADLNDQTIATLCKTKTECIKEVQQTLKRIRL